MKYEVRIGKKAVEVEVTRKSDHLFEVKIDDQVHEVDMRQSAPTLYTMHLGSTMHDVDVVDLQAPMQLAIDGEPFEVDVIDEIRRALLKRKGALDVAEGPQEILAPMPGKVVKVLVEKGAVVEEGQGVVIVEAMKMENVLKASFKGTITDIYVEAGQAVESRAPLAKIEPVKEEEAAG